MGTDIHGVIQIKKDGQFKTIQIMDSFRNYHFFSILANVRNAKGFAGCKTALYQFQFIAEPRGIPDKDFAMWGDNECHIIPSDIPFIDNYTNKSECGEFNLFWLGDHDYSYVTLSEINEVDWETPTMMTGLVSKNIYDAMPYKNQQPYEWCGDISGKDIIIIDNVKSYSKNKIYGKFPEKIYIRHNWEASYADCVGANIMAIIIKWNRMCQRRELSPYDMRIVFGFDS